MRFLTPLVAFVALFLCSFVDSFAQVGIGTTTPSANAVLELKSPDNNQGFLVPRLTTAQRTATTFTSALAAADAGLLVFDTDTNKFYYWIGSAWIVIEDSTGTDSQTLTFAAPNLSISGGNSVNLSAINTDAQNLSLGTKTGTSQPINISGGTGVTIDVADNDNSITNEIQDLSLTGNTLALSSDGTTVNLAGYLDNTDAQNLTLGTKTGTNQPINISGGTGITIDVADNDNSTTNEIQNLTLGTKTGTSQPVNISGGTGITIDVADNDNSTTNEIQNLTLGTKTGTSQPINISGGTGITIDVADNDNSTSNEIQDLSLAGNTLSLSSDGTTVSLAGFLDNTDAQNLSLGAKTGTNQPINISGGTGITIDVADNDNSTSNEIQNLTLGTKTGTSQPINISGGTGITIDVADNDNSTSNEIQDLSLAGNTLSLTSDGTTVNLAGYLDNTDAQNLSLGTKTGTNQPINISGGTGITIDVADNDNSTSNEIQDLSLAGNTLSLTSDGTTVNLAGYLDNTDAQNLSLGAKTGTNQPINISGGTGITIDVADNDNSITNEIQNLSLGTKTGTSQPINISGGTGITIDVADNDNSTLNEIQNLSLGTRTGTSQPVNISGGTGISIDVADNDNNATNEIQSLSIAGNSLTISGGNTVTLPGGGGLSGGGSDGQVAFWSGTSTVSGNSNLIWDYKDNRLGVGLVPKANFHFGGSHAVAFTLAKEGAHTVDVKDYVIIGSSSTTDVLLPDAADLPGRILIIRATDAKGLTIKSSNGKDTIDGLAAMQLQDSESQVYAVTLMSIGGTDWISLNKSRR